MSDEGPNPGRSPNPAGAESTLTASPGAVQAQLTARPGDRFGRYKILEEIGVGGGGAVFVAEQEEPVRRQVALKVIKLGMDTRQVIARFEAERQALAMMDHPNIAKVLDAGSTDTGRPFFVMELVRGVKITEYCDQHKLSTSDRLKLFIQVCQAVQHAHQKGIIHRDLKPSNILVTLQDGVPVPKVIDFGIAKATANQRLTDKTIYTAFEQFIGTPAYMSPEQADMAGLDIDTRSDIYSLGVLLYELLVGETPFRAEELLGVGLEAMRRILREKDPARPSTKLSTMTQADLTAIAQHRQSEPPKLIKSLRGDLDWVVMKCLEKDRTRRYETANGLATDIRRHLNNEPVVARPPSRLYEFQKSVRRHKFGFAAAAALILVLAVGALVSTSEAVRATRAEREQNRLRRDAVASANNERREREAAVREARRANAALSESLTTEGDRLVREKQVCRSLAYFARALRINSSNSVAATRIVSLLNERNFPLPIEPRHEPLFSFPEPPTNALMLELRGKSVVDTRSGKEISRLQFDGELETYPPPDFSPNGKFVAVGNYKSELEVFSTDTGATALPPIVNVYSGSVFTPDSRHLITVTGWSRLAIWDLAAKKLIFTGEDLGGYVRTLGLSPEGRLLATYYDTRREVQIWNVETGQAASESFAAGDPHGTPFMGLYWGVAAIYLQTGQNFGDGSADGVTRYWDTRPGGATPLVIRCSEPVAQASYDSAGQLILILTRSGIAEVHRSDDGSLITLPSIAKQTVSIATLSPDSSLLALGTVGGVVGVWQIQQQGLLWAQQANSNEVWRLVFSPDGRLVCAGERDKWGVSNASSCGVRVYDARTGELHGEIRNSLGGVEGIAVSPDSLHLSVSFHEGRTELWDLVTMKRLGEPLRCQHTWISEPRFSHDGRWLATGSGGKGDAVQLWDVVTKRPVQRFSHSHGVQKVYFSPDDTRVMLISIQDGTAQVWDRASGIAVTEPLALPQSRGRSLHVGGFSPGGRELLTSGADGTVVWDERAGRPLCAPFGHSAGVPWASFSPDGSHILTAGPGSNEVAVYPWFGVQIVLGTWLMDLAEAIAGVRLNEDGVAQQIKEPEVQIERLRKEVALADQSDPLVKWVAWYLADRTSRPLSFDSKITVHDYAQKLAARDDLPSLLEVLDLERTNAFAFSKLASLWEADRPELAALYRSIARDYAAGVLYHDHAVFALQTKSLLEAGKFTEAEPLARECLALREKLIPHEWLTFNARSMLGGCLLGQKKYEEAEPLLVSGYEGMKCRERRIPPVGKPNLRTALERLVLLNEALAAASPGNAEKRQELAAAYRLALNLVTNAGPLAADYDRLLALADQAIARAHTRTNAASEEATFWQEKGSLLEGAGRSEEALAAMTKAVELANADTNGDGLTVTDAKLGRWGLLQRMNRLAEAGDDRCQALNIPRRDGHSTTNLVDLSPFYNHNLKQNQHGGAPDNTLAALPEGLQTMGQVQFDIRGLVQLAGTELQTQAGGLYPESATSLPIGRKFARLHALQGTAWAEQEGAKVGAYVLHYADGRQLELPILYGEDVRNWWDVDDRKKASRATLAWTGQNPAISRANGLLRLYKRTWDNPRPNVVVESISFTSTMTKSAPFLIALTLE